MLGILHDDFSLIEHMFAVGRHAVQDERARAGDGMDQIGVAVVVPEWTGIFKAGLRDDDGGIAPRTGDAGRGRDEDCLLYTSRCV